MKLEDLQRLCPSTASWILEVVVEPLARSLEEFAIDQTPLRTQHFLAQVAHESAGFMHLRELGSGAAYEGNAHLGNSERGDGPRFRGWGLIQITGRKNTELASKALFGDTRLIDRPQLIDPPDLELACRSAGWFWTVGAGMNLSHAALAYGVARGVNLNELADADDFKGITLAINGGLNGEKQRLAYLETARGLA